MNIALIFAGGTGQRMNSKTKPKQFLELHGKPILVYTLEQFQVHKDIDGIVLVCLADWIDYCYELAEKFRIDKLKTIVLGGESGQESIFNGLTKVYECYSDDTTVLIHDGVRPLVDQDTITRNLDSVKYRGCAITVTPAIETIVLKGEGDVVGKIIDRKQCQVARAPQSFILKDIYAAHLKAREEHLEFIDSASMMQHYGYTLYSVEGKPENIKITTPSDFYIFRAIEDAKENSQIFGI